MAIGPAAPHQVPMPTKQCLGLDEEPLTFGSRQETTQPGEQGTICGSKLWPRHLPAKDGDLVAEDDDLDCQVSGVAPLQTEQLEHPNEGEIKEGQGHCSPSSLKTLEGNTLVRAHGWDSWHPQVQLPCSEPMDEILGTHTQHDDLKVLRSLSPESQHHETEDSSDHDV
jgi:hypothetical protein